jgi:hypothetical protein
MNNQTNRWWGVAGALAGVALVAGVSCSAKVEIQDTGTAGAIPALPDVPSTPELPVEEPADACGLQGSLSERKASCALKFEDAQKGQFQLVIRHAELSKSVWISMGTNIVIIEDSEEPKTYVQAKAHCESLMGRSVLSGFGMNFRVSTNSEFQALKAQELDILITTTGKNFLTSIMDEEGWVAFLDGATGDIRYQVEPANVAAHFLCVAEAQTN